MFDKEVTMTEEKQDIWFPAKTYGWGWGMPCAWQGWVVMIVYIGIVVVGSIVIKPTVNIKLYLIVVIVSSLLFCLVCWWKGEKPAWRWGDKK
jgi:hypothetical protein